MVTHKETDLDFRPSVGNIYLNCSDYQSCTEFSTWAHHRHGSRDPCHSAIFSIKNGIEFGPHSDSSAVYAYKPHGVSADLFS